MFGPQLVALSVEVADAQQNGYCGIKTLNYGAR